MQFAPIYPLLYKILKPAFPSCLWCGEGKAIALIFDDGPHPDHTPQLLDVLAEYGIAASFFWLGVCVARFIFKLLLKFKVKQNFTIFFTYLKNLCYLRS